MSTDNNFPKNKAAVQFITITEHNGDGQRLDNFLIKVIHGVPKSKVYQIIRTGEVRVNKGRAKPSQRLEVDDIVRIPPLQISERPEIEINQQAIRKYDLADAVLYEDDNLLIINKPAGLAVHGGSGLQFGLIEALRQQRPEQFLELVHRLDRDTSGCIMVAKAPKMLRALHEMLRDGTIVKHYHALVKGYVAKDFNVNVPLKKFVLASGERMVRVNPEEGQPALTNFKVITRYPRMSLLQAEPRTGRTHQIRVHAAYKNLPIIGDDKYGDKIFNQAVKKVGLKRMYLHAYRLEFINPLNGRKINVCAKYDDQEWESAKEFS